MPIALSVCTLLSSFAFHAQERPADPPATQAPVLEYRAPFRQSPITLDGTLDDAAWKNVPWTSDFVDIEGSAKPRPRDRTRAKMMWDDKYFYIAAEMEEPDVWGSLKNHDDIVFRDNDFEVFIDPDGDTREYYELEVNPLGTIFDLFLPRTYIDGGPAVHAWNCTGLRTHIAVQGSINDPRDVDRGWSLEWAIPWSSLVPPKLDGDGLPLPASVREMARGAAAPKSGETWRINFSRVQWKHNFEELDDAGKRTGPKERPTGTMPSYAKRAETNEDNWVWSPQGVVDMHRPERWGKVTFVREEIAAPSAPTTAPKDATRKPSESPPASTPTR